MNAGAAAQQPPPSTDRVAGRARATGDARTAGAGSARTTGRRAEDGRTKDSRTKDGRTTETRALDRDAAERVLRRAVELDDDPGALSSRVSVQALLDAADELGIDRSEVRRAVVEEELGLLEERARRTDALLGPERFVVARVVDGSVADLERRVDEWMCRGRVLRRARRGDTGGGGVTGAASAGGSSGWVDYTRRTDPVAGAQRAVHAVNGGERLAHVRRVRVVVSDLGDGRCVVGLLVDASRSRTNAAAGGTVVAATGTLASAALTLPGHVAVAVAGTAASLGAGVGVMALRRTYTASVPDELESVLDSVASGERPASVIDGVASRLLRSPRSSAG